MRGIQRLRVSGSSVGRTYLPASRFSRKGGSLLVVSGRGSRLFVHHPPHVREMGVTPLGYWNGWDLASGGVKSVKTLYDALHNGAMVRFFLQPTW